MVRNDIGLRYPLPRFDGAEGLKLIEKLISLGLSHNPRTDQALAILLESMDIFAVLNFSQEGEIAFGVMKMSP